ncbi:MAG: hypothetical protein AB7F08_02390 [Dongiaceae bacterium]
MATVYDREAVGVFHHETALRTTVDELLLAGVDRAACSLVAGHRTIERKLGHYFERVADVEDDPQMPRQAYVGTDSRTEAKGVVVGGLIYVGAMAAAGAVVASGGTVAAALIGAALAGGGGGAIGLALARVIGRHHAEHLQEQLDHGGILLWVRLRNPEEEARVVQILTRNGADGVHVHSLPELKHRMEGGESYDLSFMNAIGL